MRNLLLATIFLTTPALAAEVGTVEPQKSATLVDTATGDTWTTVSGTAPASFVLTGPAKFQVGFRVNIPSNFTEGTAGIVQVRNGGKPLAQFRLQPKTGADTWKDQRTFKPSLAVGFYVDVAAGPQTYEFRLNGGGDHGGAVRVVESSQSKRPLPATAPVVKIPTVATAVAAASPAATPAATPSSVASVASGASAWQVSIGGGPTFETESEDGGLVWSAVGNARFTPMPTTFVEAGGEWRAGKQRVPVPNTPSKGSYENRQTIDVSAGARLMILQHEVLIGPWLRFADYESRVAPRRYTLAGGRTRLGVRLGGIDLHADLAIGGPVAQDTPENYQTGELTSGGMWGLGASMSLRGNLRLGLDYRGEAVGRFASERVANSLVTNAIVEF